MTSLDLYQKVVEANIAFHETLADSYRACEPHFKGENIANVEAKILKIIKKTNASMLLDLGCGTGFIIDIAKKYVKEIHGVDVTQVMLDKVDKSGGAEIKIFKGDSGSFPVASNKYDMVTAYSFLHHLYDIIPTLKTAYKALKTGGKFYVDLEPNFYFWQEINKLDKDSLYDQIIKREIEMVKYKDEDFKKNFNLPKEIVDYAEYGKNVLGGFKEEDIKEQLTKLGFSEVEVFYYWYIGQGAIINDTSKSKKQNFKEAELIEKHLQKALPLSRNLYKYLGFIATK